ncbi:unnamed protein product [Rhodiola kirilowii]
MLPPRSISHSNSMTLLKPSVTWIVIALLISFNLSQSRGHGGSDDHDQEEGVNIRSKGLVLVKIWCLIILLVSTFAGGISPYFYRWNESFLLLGTQFAGGVFLGTSMMHFLSDSNSTFKDLTTTKEYPFAFMLASFGYLLTMFGDCIISYVNNIGNESNSRVEVEEARPGHEENTDHSHVDQMDSTPVFLKTSSSSSFGDTILLILALCFHSVFEGIAVGVSASKAEAWRNLWTISLHKVFAAIAMGIALLRMIPKRPFVTSAAYSFAFAVSSPVGIGIGIIVNATAEGKVAEWIYAISMAVACGVFIYVAINHLIAKGFKPHTKSYFDTPLYKFLAVTFGVGVIAVVMIWD